MFDSLPSIDGILHGDTIFYLISNNPTANSNSGEKKMALEFTADNFKAEVLDSDIPVMVDFWATWCAPCRAITPIIEELATENSDAKVGKLDVSAFESIAQEYGVSNIPAILVFKGGEVVDRVVGVQSKDKLQEMINNNKA